MPRMPLPPKARARSRIGPASICGHDGPRRRSSAASDARSDRRCPGRKDPLGVCAHRRSKFFAGLASFDVLVPDTTDMRDVVREVTGLGSIAAEWVLSKH